MAQNNDIVDLQKLGFSDHDAVVYLSLVDLGSATANPLITTTNLHRSIVYTSLEHLISRKLVSVSEVRGKKTFSVVSPSLLIEEFDEKKALAREMAQKIKEKLNVDSQEITIHQGNEQYLSLLLSNLKEMPQGSTKYVLGTGDKGFMEETMLPIWKKYHRTIKDQKMHIRMIGYESQRSAIEPYTSKEGVYETKYLSSGIENPAGIHIYPEIGVILNIIYSTHRSPVTAIKIKNKAFVQSYLNLFSNLWSS